MTGELQLRRLLPLALAGALVAGALTAVLVAGANARAQVVTIAGENFEAITIRGSPALDDLTVQGDAAAGGAITIIGSNRALTSESPACSQLPNQEQTAYCETAQLKQIKGPLAGGADRIRFRLDRDLGITIAGQDGNDELRGGRGSQTLGGGKGEDDLRGGAETTVSAEAPTTTGSVAAAATTIATAAAGATTSPAASSTPPVAALVGPVIVRYSAGTE